MRRPASHAQRGQTLPFWVMSVLVSLALLFFVANYAGTVKHQIHAQNAADSAAAAALGKDAAALNSTQELLAAVDIQQLKISDAEAALPYLLGTTPCGPANLLTSNCVNALEGAVTDVTTLQTKLQDLTATINSFETQTTGNPISAGQVTGLLTNPQQTVSQFFAPNGSGGCAVKVLTDCDYRYTTIASQNSYGYPVIDEYACKTVQNTAWAFLHLPMQKYWVIGHTTSTIAPISSAYNAQSLGKAFATTLNLFPSAGSSGTGLTGDLSALNINTNFYGAVATKPLTAAPAAAQICPPLS